MFEDTQVNPSNLFKHRFDATQIHDPREVHDAFNAMLDHVNGVLMLLHSQFDKECTLSNAAMQNAVGAVMQGINDMEVVMNAHFEAVKLSKESAK